MRRAPRRADTAANARPVIVVDYVGDPIGDADQRSIDGEYARGMQGLSGLVYAGDKGGPAHSYTGALPYALQAFYGQAGATNILKAKGPSFDTTPVTGPQAAPIYRMLAQKVQQGR